VYYASDYVNIKNMYELVKRIERKKQLDSIKKKKKKSKSKRCFEDTKEAEKDSF
jgi:hypothetical protein